MALSIEDQERIRKRWESRQSGSAATTPVSTGSTAESGGTRTGTSLLSDSDKERIKARWNQRFDIDESYVNTFLTDANKFLTQAQTDYKKLDWNSATSESSLNYYKAMQQTENDLSNRAIKIQNYLNVNKGKIDEETYNNLSSYLENFTSPQFSKLFFDARDYYSQWESADAYDTAVRQAGYQKKYEGKSYSDLKGILANMEDGEEKQWLTNLAIEAGDQELAAIKHKIAVEIPKQVQEWMDKFRSTSDPALKKQYFDQAGALEEKSYELEQEYKEIESFLSKAKNEPTWFRNNHLFDDGWQFGDVTKTVLGSGTDLFEHIGSGIIGMGEKLLDAALTIAPYVAQGQYYANGGGYNLQADRAFDAYIDAGKKGNAEIVKKDLYDENAIAKAIISDPLKSFTGIDAEMDSVFGEKTDSLAQSGGQLLAQIGANVVAPGSGLVLTGATSLGGEAENALNNGATLDEAAFSGVFSAAAEVITEKIGGISFGGKTLTDTLTDQLAKKATSKIAKFLVGTGKISLNALAEGGEEILSGYASAVGQKMSYMSDKELEELFSNEDALEAFIGGVVLGGLGEVGDIAKSAHDGVSYATGPSKTEQPLPTKLNIDELVDETIAQHTGAPADPVSAAVDGFRQSGTVTNKQATDILNSVKAVQQIVKETGVKLDGLTASGRRAAVKQAVMDYAQKQAVQAEQNFTGRAAYQDLLSDENSQPDRPGDVRPMDVPKVDGYGRKVSEFVGNAYGAEVTPDSFVPVIEELVQEGALGYDTKTNAESLREAASVIEKKGMAGARNTITKNIANGKVGDTDIAAAMLLYNKYASKKGQQSQDSAAELFVDLQMMATQTGRDLQLFKMLRKMTPQGQLMAITKKVDRYVDSINKGRSKNKQAEVSIPKELLDEYTTAAQEAAVTDTPEKQQRKDAAEQAIYAYAASNIPATIKEKWDSWRYLAMLGNPKTQIRNLVGNALFRPFVETKRYLGTAMEAMVLKPEQRTKSIIGTDADSRALLSWAKQDAKTQSVTDRMEYTATTGDSAPSDIGDQRQIFKTKLLEKARTGLNDLMSAEDMIFKRSAYATSLASFLKARSVTAQQVQDGSVDASTLKAARDYAVEEAMKATFNDHNAFSDIFVNFRYKGNNPVMKLLNTAAEGILPFRRTPANIVARATEYSPIGLAKTIVADSGKVRNGSISAAEYIDNLASGITGTGAMALGYALAAGIIEGVRLVGNEDDEDEKRMGHQSYALEIGDISIPIDWAAPAVLPLFMGANLYATLNPESEEVSTSAFIAFLDACANTLEPMLELSCLSSLNDLLTDARYAEEGRELYAIAASAATSYLLQGLPTLGGQIEQAFENEKKSVYADSSDPFIREVQQTIGRATQKIPGIDLFQTEKVDAWGEPQEKKGVVESIFDAFINPAYDSLIEETAVDAEISRLNSVQSENVSPCTPSKTITYTGTDGTVHADKRLTSEEYSSLAKLQGQTQKQLVEDLISHEAYALLSDADKANAIRFAYAYARDIARGEVVPDHPGITTKWMAELEGDIAEGILRHVTQSDLTDALSSVVSSWKDIGGSQKAIASLEQAYKTFTGLPVAMQGNIFADSGGRVKYFLTAKDAGISSETFANLYKTFYDIDNGNGKASEKASQWSYELEKAQERGIITPSQKAALKEEMNFWQMIPAETSRFDELTGSGLSADKASYVDELLDGLLDKPRETKPDGSNYANVRTIQQIEAIVAADKELTEAQQRQVLEDILDVKAFAKYEQVIALGYNNDEYAATYRLYLDTAGGKARTIEAFQKEFGISKAAATALYEIYVPK